jgi:hypothetical protein
MKVAMRVVPAGVTTSALALVNVSKGEKPLTRRFSI